MPAVARTDAARLARLLPPQTMWGPVEVVGETGSTNADLMARLGDGAGPGLVRVAEHQTAGQGRFDRTWVDVPGASLAVSVVVRPTRQQASWGWLPLLTGMAVVAGLSDWAGERVGLKWPNDVLLDGAKVCGVLAQSDGRQAVLGFGLNVGLARDELPVPAATSLLVAGLPTDKTVVLGRVLTALQTYFQMWDGGADMRGVYVGVSETIGRRVRVVQPGRAVQGVAVGVDESGALLVRVDGGATEVFTAGDVTHLR